MKIETININFDNYPALLRGIAKPPQTLYCLGNTSLLNSKCVAIIGTRGPSDRGYDVAYRLGKRLADDGYTVVGGLCVGIDTAGHRGALDAGGHTIAILACPLNAEQIQRVHNNGELAHRIVKNGGLLITEYAQPVQKFGYRYIERDRLQSGLSPVVVPVQCGNSSGTLHTVRAGLEQGRSIFVPGVDREDYAAYPQKYAGIVQLVASKKATVFGASTIETLYDIF